MFKSSWENFVQILNVSRSHWICASNMYCLPSVVDVYDSIPAYSLGVYSLYKQLAAIMRYDGSELVVRFVDVQRQSGGDDCGVFAIAFAQALSSGVDPHSVTLDQNRGRAHLLYCFKTRKMKRFPQQLKPRRVARRRVSVEKR